ncbi:MAG: DUF1731 domain-containing protein, partial [Catalinimonas sp.]
VPAWLTRVGTRLLGTEAELVLHGRRAVPARLLREGFSFRFPTLPEALRDLYDVRPAASLVPDFHIPMSA